MKMYCEFLSHYDSSSEWRLLLMLCKYINRHAVSVNCVDMQSDMCQALHENIYNHLYIILLSRIIKINNCMNYCSVRYVTVVELFITFVHTS